MAEQTLFEFASGNSPLLISMPHAGTFIPEDIAIRMTDSAKRLPDTDWYVHQLYDFSSELSVSMLKANYSRYVVDLNRSPDGVSLYPGQSVTEVCPTTLFNDEAIYLPSGKPNEDEVSQRIEHYWQPYHDQIRRELQRMREKYGYALLLDAHSIKSHVPRFFEGQLPDFNWGSGNGSSCDASLSQNLLNRTLENSGYTSVLNGRFKGGYITRSNGNPAENIHAIQLELSQATYLHDEETFQIDPVKMAALQNKLKELIDELLHQFQ